MAVVLIQQPPEGVTLEMVEQLGMEMGVHENPPDGLIVHTAIAGPDGPEIIDVWESQQHYERFRDARLLPAIAKMTAASAAEVPQPRDPQFYDVVDLVRGR